MRILFIGCVTFSRHLLQALLRHEDAEIVGVVTRESSAQNADFCDLSPLAAAHGIPCFSDSRQRTAELVGWIQERRPDVLYCFGWSSLLKREVLELAPLGAIGYHPAPLPQNRGRHPVIWALALGLTETASTFFFMDEGADSGDIVDQEKVAITPDDDAASLYQKLINCALGQLTQITAALARGSQSRRRQEHGEANYWRKRSARDGAIDWRMSCATIHNLVRALARPYPGAHFLLEQAEVKVWKTEPADHPLAWAPNLEPGKVLEVAGTSLVVKCGSGAIRLLQHELPAMPEPGSYL